MVNCITFSTFSGRWNWDLIYVINDFGDSERKINQ